MTIRQGVSERAVDVKDSRQVDAWLNKEAIPLLKELRDAVNGLLGTTTATPTGPAGGQLGGTYPDPDVRGVRETAGPTELTMGSVADGEFLKRSGLTVIGGTPPAPTSTPPVTERGFRSYDQGGAYVSGTSRIHIAAFGNTGGPILGGTVAALRGIGAGQMAYAYGEYFEKAGNINRLAIRTNGTVGSAGTPRVRMGVYADSTLASGTLTGSPYPGSRIGQSASIDLWQGGANKIIESTDLTIPVDAGTYVWFVIMYNNQAVTNQHTIPVMGYLWPTQGISFNPAGATTIAQDAQTSGVGWQHAVTFGTAEDCPDPFPQTAPVILVDTVLSGATANLPAIGFGFQQS